MAEDTRYVAESNQTPRRKETGTRANSWHSIQPHSTVTRSRGMTRGHRWRTSFRKMRRASLIESPLGTRPAGLGERDENRSQRHGTDCHIPKVRKHSANLGGGALLVEPAFDEADDRAGRFRLQPTGRPLARYRRGCRERDGDLPKTGTERLEFLGELQPATIQVADVAGEALDLGKVVRRDEDGGVFGAWEEAFDQLVANQRVESRERLVQHHQLWAVSQRGGQRCLHPHPVRE